jgi:type II secretory pathway pseudopilin PulG
MNEDIAGYLLGALDRDAAERVEQQLADSVELRRELDRIGQAMRPLGEDGDVDPPPRLAERTIQRVLRCRQQEPCAAAATSTWRLTDLAVAAGILMMISAVILPALQQSRQQSLLAACTNNLRTLGVALQSYSDDHGGYYPFYTSNGPLAVAGMYAPLLLESGYVADSAAFVCPASGDQATEIPRVAQLRAAVHDIQWLSQTLRSLGGSYGSSLGAQVGGVYCPPRRDCNSGPILTDRPLRPCEGDVGHSNSPNHGDRGQNALYPDGGVKFLPRPCECDGCDNIFQSLHGLVEPGRAPRDVVIGPSDARLNEKM